MAKLKAAARNKLKGKQFALPSERKYPIEDASHARNALARASEMHNQGRITDAQLAEIDSKARAKLGQG
jgi:uncharacterized protein DUF6582